LPFDVLQIIIIVSAATLITLGIIGQYVKYVRRIRCRNCGSRLKDEDFKCPICNYGDPDNLLAQAQRLWNKSNFKLAIEALTIAVQMNPTRGDIWYEKARYECRLGQFDNAIVSLTVASSFEGGYVTFAQFVDEDFKPLRLDSRFLKLVKQRKEELPELDEEAFRMLAPHG